LSVKDTGCAIEEDKQNSIFELFGDGVVSENNINQQGIGLGLSVSKMICKRLDGDLILDWSKLDAGSKFSIFIPISAQNQERLNLFSFIDVVCTEEDCEPIETDTRSLHLQTIL
jgi:signal transduction histidine kinase